jgi:hypothetical protein
MQRAFRMDFRYNGNDCSGGFNLQPTTLYVCEDYGPRPGPPPERGAVSYIEAFELGGGEVYFSGLVEVGSVFSAVAADRMSANMNITIYDVPAGETNPANIVQPQNILQTVIYHSSCSQNLYLKDRFGAVQLVEFENILQGIVTCFVTVDLNFDLNIPIEVTNLLGPIELTALQVVTNLGAVDLTSQVQGQVLGAGSTISIAQAFPIDLTVRQKFTAITIIRGVTETGQGCFGTDFFEFLAGNPLPLGVPSIAPTGAPTTTPAPTPDPLTTPCDIEASIDCVVTGGGRCSGIESPAGVTCLGDSATALEFLYDSAKNCDNDSNNQDKFKCTNRGTSFPNEVYVTISGKKDAVFFEGAVTSGQIFKVDSIADDQVDIEIATVSNGAAGSVIQESKLSIKCEDKDALTLLDTFGSLQLVGFTNPELGSNSIFKEIRLEYSITSNIPGLSADILEATRASAFSPLTDLTEGAPLTLRSSSPLIFPEVFTLNLSESAGKTFDFSFFVRGQGSASLLECSANDSLMILVN